MAFLNLLLLLPLAWAELSVTEPAARIANAVDFHAKQHADHEKHEEKDENSKATEQKAPATQHWWGRFWPFVLPGTPMRSDIADSVQLDEQNHHEHGKEEKGNDHKSAVDHGAETNKGHWWDHLWPFAMSTQAEISPNSQLLADGQALSGTKRTVEILAFHEFPASFKMHSRQIQFSIHLPTCFFLMRRWLDRIGKLKTRTTRTTATRTMSQSRIGGSTFGLLHCSQRRPLEKLSAPNPVSSCPF